MKKTTRDIFKQLEDSRSAKRLISPLELSHSTFHFFGSNPYSSILGRPSGYRGSKETLASFAQSLKMPVDLLIQQFNQAGLSGLTPDYKIDATHKGALLAYLRAQHGAGEKKPIKLYRKEVVSVAQIEVVQDVNEELLSLLARDPTLMYHLAPRKFEEMVARLFEDRGYSVTLTPQTRDGGYDLFAELHDSVSSFLVIAECKRYKPENKVGVEVVRGLYGVTEARRANQGLIITSSFFTKDAQEEKRLIGARMGLKDYNDLVKWLAPYCGP